MLVVLRWYYVKYVYIYKDTYIYVWYHLTRYNSGDCYAELHFILAFLWIDSITSDSTSIVVVVEVVIMSVGIHQGANGLLTQHQQVLQFIL